MPIGMIISDAISAVTDHSSGKSKGLNGRTRALTRSITPSPYHVIPRCICRITRPLEQYIDANLRAEYNRGSINRQKMKEVIPSDILGDDVAEFLESRADL